MIIPDAIEPYYGVKWLRAYEDGTLASRHNSVRWPEDGPLVAQCYADWGEEWQAVPSEQAQDRVFFDADETQGMYYSKGWLEKPTGEKIRFEEGLGSALVQRTSIVLPRGLSWSWEKIKCPHGPAPDESCTCGIYVVEKAKDCKSYAYSGCVLVKVALWGEVVIAERGARGQFAYPIEVLEEEGTNHLRPLVEKRYSMKKTLEPTPEIPPPASPTQTSKPTSWRERLCL